MIAPDALHQIDKLLGPRGYLDQPEDLQLYEYDGSIDKARPELVVFPQTSEQALALVRIAREHHIPMVGRGAGTGLSGGVIAVVCGGARAKLLEVFLGGPYIGCHQATHARR